MRISDWSSDVCSSDLVGIRRQDGGRGRLQQHVVESEGFANFQGHGGVPHLGLAGNSPHYTQRIRLHKAALRTAALRPGPPPSDPDGRYPAASPPAPPPRKPVATT